MTVTFKDAIKFVGIVIITCCAVFVCNMFLNYDFDLRAAESGIEESSKVLYEALKLNNIVVCAVSGGCLVLTSAVMLVFYIGQYIRAHSAKFGILKALGYSDLKLALPCAVFGFCVFAGSVIGYALSWALMPQFYALQNDGGINVDMKFHASLPLLLIVLPTVVFSIISVGISLIKLRLPVLSLIKGDVRKERYAKSKENSQAPFLRQLAFNVLKEKKSLAFFIAFGAFCFSSMTQMGLSMKDYASDMMGIMILVIGLILAATSLWLAMSTVVGANAKKIAMLKCMGYSVKECGLAVLCAYHIPAVIGFAIGCAYQYGILNIMVNVVFSSFDDVPVYSFNTAAFAVCLALFAVAYEALNIVYIVIIGKTPLKAVMSE